MAIIVIAVVAAAGRGRDDPDGQPSIDFTYTDAAPSITAVNYGGS